MNSLEVSKTSQRFDFMNLAILSAFLLFLRFPFFYPTMIHWDENTFTLIGADILKGYLPYERLWDIKPPLCFAAYALFLKLFGMSIFAVRIGGFFCILLSAFIIYSTASRLYSRTLGLMAGLALIFYSNTGDFYQVVLMHDFQAVMSEHVALLPLTAALALFLLKTPLSKWNAFWLGVLSGAVLMIRFNLVYFAGVLTLAIFLREMKQDKKTGFLAWIFFTLGHLVIFLLVILPYAWRHELLMLWERTLPLYWAYAEQKVQSFPAMINSFGKLVDIDLVIFAVVTFGFLMRLAQHFVFRKKSDPNVLWYIYMLFAGAILSIFQAGSFYPHYLIQLAPFFGLLCCDAITAASVYVPKRILAFFFIFFFLIQGSLLGIDHYRSWQDKTGVFQDTPRKVADYLNEKGIKGQPAFFLSDHVGYFLTDTEIPTYYVQPSNLVQRYILGSIDGPHMTPELALKRVFEQQPVYIVRPAEIFYFSVACPECYPVLRGELKKNYELEKVIDHLSVYRKKLSSSVTDAIADERMAGTMLSN